MARKTTLTPDQISAVEQCVQLSKEWNSTLSMQDLWKAEAPKKNFPKPYVFRTTLAVNGVALESVFVTGWFKKSKIPGERDKVYLSLFVNEVRAIAVDDGPITTFHTNTIGTGLPFYQQKIGHPHIHWLIDGQYGYAEPLEEQDGSGLWLLFSTKANIVNVPGFSLPPGQLELPYGL